LNTPACVCSSSSFRRLLFPSNSFTDALSPAQSAAAGVAELRALTVVDFAEQVIKLWPVTEGHARLQVGIAVGALHCTLSSGQLGNLSSRKETHPQVVVADYLCGSVLHKAVVQA